MATLRERRRGRHPKGEKRSHPVSSFQDLVNWYQITGGGTFQTGVRTTMVGEDSEGIPANLEGLTESALKANSIVWTLEMLRMAIFSEARFAFRSIQGSRPGPFLPTTIDILRKPWPNGTTGDLATAMIVDADVAGNAFIVNAAGELVRLRPDWVTILLEDRRFGRTSSGEIGRLGKRLTGYAYTEGGVGSGNEPVVLMPNEVAHFAPFPDPTASFRGMSWMTPVVREIKADNQATDHKSAFWQNAATPNAKISFDPAIVKTQDQMDEWIDVFEALHRGPERNGNTLYLGAGADMEVIGRDFQQMDYKNVVGAGETRLAAAAGLTAVVAGFSEGMQGSSLNAGNYQVIKRKIGDTTFRPLWRNAAGSLETIVRPPPGAELWFDTRDVAFLRDDEKDEANIFGEYANGIRQLTDGGYDPETVVAAAAQMDIALLDHTGLLPIQVQPPGTTDGEGDGNGNDDE